jgi:hypothetical protein
VKPVRWGMRTVLSAGASAFALSACATGDSVARLQAARAIIQELHTARCGGSFDLDAGAATGQLGGGAHFDLDIEAECPVGDAPAPVPIREFEGF